jgi:hypothetical protein
MSIFADMERTAMMKLIDMLDLHIELHKENAGRFDTGAMIAKNYALALLKDEKENITNAYWDERKRELNHPNKYEYYQKKYGYGQECTRVREELPPVEGWDIFG